MCRRSFWLMLCYVMLRYVVLCYVMLCYVMLCYVMLCYVMLCYVMLCYVMLCYWRTNSKVYEISFVIFSKVLRGFSSVIQFVFLILKKLYFILIGCVNIHQNKKWNKTWKKMSWGCVWCPRALMISQKFY